MKWNKWKTATDSLVEIVDELANPGCGWYEIHSFWAEKDVSEEEICACLNTEDRLVLVRIHLGAYRNAPLDEAAIRHMEQILSVFEQAEKDVILRCCYDFEGKGMIKEPGLFSRVMTHMSQVAEVIRKYDRVIFLYQGILLGSWGEMHTSKFLIPERIRELSTVLAEETERRVWRGVRRPIFLHQLLKEPVDIMEAREEKLTIFDDGIFGSPTHLGTFDRPEDVDLLKKLATVAPYGGEVVGGEDALKWSLPETIDHIRRLHVSYLNRRHDEAILKYWEGQQVLTSDCWNGMNGRDYIGRHLGYRFHICSIHEKKKLLNICVENTGFSDIYEEVELVLLQKDLEGVVHESTCLTKNCLCQSGETIKIALRVPQEAGTYYLALRRKKDNRRIYFSNPANENGWVHIGTIH